MLHGSYGTLGILTKWKFRLVKARPFVKMTYHRFSRFEDFWAFLEPRCHAEKDDFIDAIVFAPDHFAAPAQSARNPSRENSEASRDRAAPEAGRTERLSASTRSPRGRSSSTR